MRRYPTNVRKALEVILWFAEKSPSIDIYHVVKGAFYADKPHIRKYGRPITGDHYVADTFGPLPKVIYGILRRDPFELLALQSNGDVPARLVHGVLVKGDRSPNRALLSKSDEAALEEGWQFVKDKSFQELYDLTHSDRAYLLADGGTMDYRNFLDEHDKDYEEKAAYIEEVAPSAVF
jgi:hypothetical protein